MMCSTCREKVTHTCLEETVIGGDPIWLPGKVVATIHVIKVEHSLLSKFPYH